MSKLQWPFSRLPLWKRILAAAAGVVAVHFFFTLVLPLVPALSKGRAANPLPPRFHPEAWNDAVAALKEEVGADAVEKGVFRIPKAELAVPSAGECRVSSDTGEIPFDMVSRHELREFIYDASGGLFCTNLGGGEAAVLSAGDAQNLWAALAYLDRVEVAGWSGEVFDPDEEAFTLALYEGTGRRAKPVVDTEEWWSLWSLPLRDELRNRCAYRLVSGWTGAGRLNFSIPDAELSAIVAKRLPELIAPSNEIESWLASACVWVLERAPSKRAAPLLSRIERLEASRCAYDALSSTRYLGWLFRPRKSDVPLPDVRMALIAARTLAGKSREERLSILSRVAVDPQSDERHQAWAWQVLARADPERARRLILQAFPSLSVDRQEYLLHYAYEDYFGDDVRLAELGVKSSDQLLRFYSLLRLYAINRSPALVEPIKSAFPTWVQMSAARGFEWEITTEELAKIYLKDRTSTWIRDVFIQSLTQLPYRTEDYSDLLPPSVDGAEIPFIAVVLSGGHESAEAVLALIDVYQKSAAAEDLFSFPYFCRPGAAKALINAKDPFLAAAMTGYLKECLPELDGMMCDTFIDSVSAMGYVDALPVLEEALEHELKQPSGRSAVTIVGAGGADKRQSEVKFVDSLKGAVLAVRVANAADPLGVLLTSSETGNRVVRRHLPEILAARFGEEGLKKLLADDAAVPVRPIIYRALIRSRQDEWGVTKFSE